MIERLRRGKQEKRRGDEPTRTRRSELPLTGCYFFTSLWKIHVKAQERSSNRHTTRDRLPSSLAKGTSTFSIYGAEKREG
jgi:hypothetical protein